MPERINQFRRTAGEVAAGAFLRFLAVLKAHRFAEGATQRLAWAAILTASPFRSTWRVCKQTATFTEYRVVTLVGIIILWKVNPTNLEVEGLAKV